MFMFVMLVGLLGAFFSLVATVEMVGDELGLTALMRRLPGIVMNTYVAGFFLGGVWALGGPLLILPALIFTAKASDRAQGFQRHLWWMWCAAAAAAYSWIAMLHIWSNASW